MNGLHLACIFCIFVGVFIKDYFKNRNVIYVIGFTFGMLTYFLFQLAQQ